MPAVEDRTDVHRDDLAERVDAGIGASRDGEVLEGVMPNNLLNDPGGVTIVPPDPSFQNQRIFVPREAASSVEVLGVIGSPLRKPAAKKRPLDADKQLEMFS